MKPYSLELLNMKTKANHGFTLLELVVVITIAALASAWTIPNMQRQFEQQKIEYYTQNLETGIFNLIANVEKAPSIALFGSQGESNKYLKPDALIELTTISQAESTSLEQCRLRREYLDCPDQNNSCGVNPDEFLKFRFLSKEKTKDSESIEVLTSQTNYQLSPQGTNPRGEDIIFRIRSRKWDQYPGLITLPSDLKGHLFKGTWEYGNPTNNPKGCQSKCPLIPTAMAKQDSLKINQSISHSS